MNDALAEGRKLLAEERKAYDAYVVESNAAASARKKGHDVSVALHIVLAHDQAEREATKFFLAHGEALLAVAEAAREVKRAVEAQETRVAEYLAALETLNIAVAALNPGDA